MSSAGDGLDQKQDGRRDGEQDAEPGSRGRAAHGEHHQAEHAYPEDAEQRAAGVAVLHERIQQHGPELHGEQHGRGFAAGEAQHGRNVARALGRSRLDPMATEPHLTAAGVVELRDSEGRLHAEGEPARVFPNGREEWYRHGRLHREEGPAILHANGSTKWYFDGVRHREGGPACEYVSGLKKWYRHGKQYRVERP